MNIIQVFRKFPDKKACIDHLEDVRWHEYPICPYCQSANTTKLKKDFRHHCNTCNTHFSVTVNTILHDTRLPLQKWFLAISIILNAKKGISSRQLARDIEVNKDTAWSMQMRIRQAMVDDGKFMTGIVEMDETYVGGKPRKINNKDDDRPNKRGRGTKKTPVVGIIERGGKVYAQKQEILSFKNLKKVFNANAKDAILMTDDFRGYSPFKKENIEHMIINHSSGHYANGIIHTNNIESFWAIVKRGIIGQYHHVSKQYLNEYLKEFSFRFNHRKSKNGLAFNLLIANCLGV